MTGLPLDKCSSRSSAGSASGSTSSASDTRLAARVCGPTVASLVGGIVVIAPIAARSGVMPSRASLLRPAVAAGVTLGVADSALTTALQRGPLTVASVLGNLYPLVTIALGVALLGERVRIWHAAGILLAVAGVAMIAAGE